MSCLSLYCYRGKDGLLGVLWVIVDEHVLAFQRDYEIPGGLLIADSYSVNGEYYSGYWTRPFKKTKDHSFFIIGISAFLPEMRSLAPKGSRRRAGGKD